MIDGLSFAITVVALASAVTVAVQGGVGRFRAARAVPAVVLVEVALVVQAALDVAGLAGGHRPGEFATHVAYLVASLLVLPLALAEIARDDGRWSAAVLAVALLVAAVLVVRLQTTWRGAGA